MIAMRLEDVAERWQCSRSLVYSLIKEGKLPAIQFGGRLLRVRLEDVERYEACNLSSVWSYLEAGTMPDGASMDEFEEHPCAPKVVRLPSRPYAISQPDMKLPTGRKP